MTKKILTSAVLLLGAMLLSNGLQAQNEPSKKDVKTGKTCGKGRKRTG